MNANVGKIQSNCKQPKGDCTFYVDFTQIRTLVNIAQYYTEVWSFKFKRSKPSGHVTPIHKDTASSYRREQLNGLIYVH